MRDYSHVRTVAPAVEPVTLDEAKRHCNVVTEDEDDLLTSLIVAAREQVETDSNRSLITQTHRIRLQTWWGGNGVFLPRPRLQSAVVTYIDSDGVTQTLAADQYEVDTDREPGLLWWADGADAPPTLSTSRNAITITYVAGYGDDPATVPQRAKQAILLLVGHWYRAREAVIVGTISGEIELAYRSIIGGLRPGRYL